MGAAPATGPHYCLAISTSSDSTGSYDAYDIYFPPNVNGFPAYIDAAKLAIWADGSSWSGLGRYAGVYFSASQGVTCGFPLAQVRSPVSSLSWVCLYLPFGGSSLPFDLEGSPGVNNTTLPAPLGTPEYYAGVGSALLGLFQFAPDFSAGTATVSTQTFVPLAAKTTACEDQFGHQVEDCIPQSGTLNELEALGFTAMYRASYRNFGTRESMVVNESVQDNPASPQVGVRWYQLATTSPRPPHGPSAP